MSNGTVTNPDIALIGAGIMSSTLGVFLKELDPSLSMVMLETLEGPGRESSEAWNNAGTGHAANCEMNYTPERADGSIDISKALDVNVEFDLSRQFWAYLVNKGAIPDPRSFIHPVPHMSFVHTDQNVSFLKRRYAAMSAHHCYRGMEYTEDRTQIGKWAPLVMEGRAPGEPVAATRIVTGTDVDYGSLTDQLAGHLTTLPGFSAHYLVRRITLHAKRMGSGASGRNIRAPERKYPSPPNSCSSALEAVPFHCCRSPKFPKGKDMAAFPSAAYGCAVMIPPSTNGIMPRCTARLRSDRHRCPCLISTPA